MTCDFLFSSGHAESDHAAQGDGLQESGSAAAILGDLTNDLDWRRYISLANLLINHQVVGLFSLLIS